MCGHAVTPGGVNHKQLQETTEPNYIGHLYKECLDGVIQLSYLWPGNPYLLPTAARLKRRITKIMTFSI